MTLLKIQNLEKKFEKQDEININNGDRLEELKDLVEKNSKNINQNFSNIEIIFDRIKDLKSNIDENNENLNNEFNDKLSKLKNYIDEKINE